MTSAPTPPGDGSPPPPKKVVGRPFPKGVSPNPGGVPKNPGPPVRPINELTIPQIDALFLEAMPKALGLLLAVIEDTKERTSDRVRAAICIVNKVKADAVAKDATGAEQETALADFVEAIKAKPPVGGGDAPS